MQPGSGLVLLRRHLGVARVGTVGVLRANILSSGRDEPSPDSLLHLYQELTILPGNRDSGANQEDQPLEPLDPAVGLYNSDQHRPEPVFLRQLLLFRVYLRDGAQQEKDERGAI